MPPIPVPLKVPEGALLGYMPTFEMLILLSCTTNQFKELHKEGVVVRVGHNLYDADRSLANLLAKLRSKGKDPEAASSRDELATAQAQIAQLKLKKLRGEVVPLDELEAVWGEAMSRIRQAILAVPAATAFELPHLTKHDLKKLEEKHRAVLAMLAAKAPKPKSKIRNADEDEDE